MRFVKIILIIIITRNRFSVSHNNVFTLPSNKIKVKFPSQLCFPSLFIRSFIRLFARQIFNNLHKATKRFLSTCFPSSEVSSKHIPLPPLASLPVFFIPLFYYIDFILNWTELKWKRWDETRVKFIYPILFLHFTGMYILRYASSTSCTRDTMKQNVKKEIQEMYLFNYLWMNCLEYDDISDTVWKSFSSLRTADAEGGVGREQVRALYLLSACFPFFTFSVSVSLRRNKFPICVLSTIERPWISISKIGFQKDAEEFSRALHFMEDMVRLRRDLIQILGWRIKEFVKLLHKISSLIGMRFEEIQLSSFFNCCTFPFLGYDVACFMFQFTEL